MRRRRCVEVVGAECLWHERGRRGRDRLCSRRAFAWNVAGRCRALHDREHGLARLAIEHEHEAVFRCLRHGVDRLAVPLDRHEHGRRREVVVPEIVVNRLEVPDPLPGGGVHRDHRVGEQVVPEAIAAVEVRARRADRQEHQASLEVGRDGGPDVRGTREARPGLPGVVPELARMGDRVERPAKLAGPHVEGPHVTGRRVRAHEVGDGRADDHDVSHDRAGRTDVVLPRIVEGGYAVEQADLTAVAEIAAGLSGGGVQREEARIERREHHPRGARSRRGAHFGICSVGPGLPVRDAAVHPHVGVVPPMLEPRVERPQLGAGFGIEGDHPIPGSREDEAPFPQDGCRLEGAPAVLLQRERAAPEITVPVAPHFLERGHVLLRDVGERRITSTAGAPLGVGPAGFLGERCTARHGEEGREAHAAQGLPRLFHVESSETSARV